MFKRISFAFLSLAISSLVSLAHADAMSDNECARIKRWVSGVPEGEQQMDILLSYDYFTKHFGKTYESLTMKEISSLYGTADYHCPRWGQMTSLQLRMAKELLNPHTHDKWVSSPHAQPTQPIAATPPADTPLPPAAPVPNKEAKDQGHSNTTSPPVPGAPSPTPPKTAENKDSTPPPANTAEGDKKKTTGQKLQEKVKDKARDIFDNLLK